MIRSGSALVVAIVTAGDRAKGAGFDSRDNHDCPTMRTAPPARIAKRKKIVLPGWTRRDPGGRRVYITQHIGWLLFLDRLRYAGMTVRDMRRYATLSQKQIRRAIH